MSEHVDVLIVGAGLSGIGAAHHIQAAFPDKTYAILEARDAIGGTWDLFRYPGVRSDSDMYTLGYRFRPWTQAEAIADGPSIIGYVRDTAAEAAIDKHIRFDHRATWSTSAARWTVQAVHGAETRTLTCGFLLMCSGHAHDVITLRHGKINDGSMRFSRLTGAEARPEVAGFTTGRSV